jgi:hypothetical protein
MALYYFKPNISKEERLMKVRKIVAGLAAVSMLAAFSAQAVFAADSVTIKAGNASAKAGEDFTLDVSLEGVPAQGISAIEFAVTYDPKVVTVTGVSAGKITNNGVDDTEKFDGVTVFTAGYKTSGLVTITYSTGLSDAKYCITDDGVIATISGTVAKDAADGEYPVKITAISRETVEGAGDTNKEIKAGYIAADKTVTKYTCTTTAGSITVGSVKESTEPSSEPTSESGTTKATKYGDANCDGTVDIIDVIKVNKFLLGSDKLTAEGKANADVDANNVVDTTDSLNILKCVVEMIDQADFPIK